MARPTWATLANSNVVVITDPQDCPSSISEANPALVIPMSGLQASGLNQPASMVDPEKVILSLVILADYFNRINAAEDNFLEVSTPRASLTQRNSRNMYSFDYTVTVYKQGPTNLIPDPDTLDQEPSGV